MIFQTLFRIIRIHRFTSLTHEIIEKKVCRDSMQKLSFQFCLLALLFIISFILRNYKFQIHFCCPSFSSFSFGIAFFSQLVIFTTQRENSTGKLLRVCFRMTSRAVQTSFTLREGNNSSCHQNKWSGLTPNKACRYRAGFQPHQIIKIYSVFFFIGGKYEKCLGRIPGKNT